MSDTIDTSNPSWQRGQADANRILELCRPRPSELREALLAAEVVSEMAQLIRDDDLYLKTHGFITTIRERQQEVSD